METNFFIKRGFQFLIQQNLPRVSNEMKKTFTHYNKYNTQYNNIVKNGRKTIKDLTISNILYYLSCIFQEYANCIINVPPIKSILDKSRPCASKSRAGNRYKKEELIYDIQKNKKITSQELMKNYLKGDGLKMMSVLNNKIILQEDESINLFSLKNEIECGRFIDSISSHFFKIKRGDCLFIKDYSSAQRKYLYNLLESNGIDKKILYRKFTTYPRVHSK
jgi:hypothetical protein